MRQTRGSSGFRVYGFWLGRCGAHHEAELQRQLEQEPREREDAARQHVTEPLALQDELVQVPIGAETAAAQAPAAEPAWQHELKVARQQAAEADAAWEAAAAARSEASELHQQADAAREEAAAAKREASNLRQQLLAAGEAEVAGKHEEADPRQAAAGGGLARHKS